MTSSVLDLYDRLRRAPDDETRARIIAEAFEALEERYPHLGDMATRTDLSETELRLVKEIEQVRLETEAVRSDLKVEIEKVRADLTKEIEKVRSDLTKEIEKTRADLTVEIARSHSSWLKWSFLFWVTQFGAIVLLLWRVWSQG